MKKSILKCLIKNIDKTTKVLSETRAVKKISADLDKLKAESDNYSKKLAELGDDADIADVSRLEKTIDDLKKKIARLESNPDYNDVYADVFKDAEIFNTLKNYKSAVEAYEQQVKKINEYIEYKIGISTDRLSSKNKYKTNEGNY